MEPDQVKIKNELSKYEKKVSEESIIKAEKTAVKFKDDKRISAFWERIQIMFEIAKHPKIWGRSVALWVGAALIYLVSPIDIIPDILPGVGLSDDVIAILLVLNRVSVAVKNLILQNPSYYLQMFAEKLRHPAMELFGIESADEIKPDSKPESDINKKVKFFLLYNGILGASHMAKHLGSVVEKEREKEKPNSLRARFNSFLLMKMENIADWAVEKNFVDSIQESIDLAVEKKTTKVLLSIISFSFALATYGMTQFGSFWVYVSSILMLCSYSFILVALINFFKYACTFITGGFSGKSNYPFFSYFDGAVGAVVSIIFKIDQLYTKKIMDELKANKHVRKMILRIAYRMFNGEISRGIIHFIMLSVVFFLVKWITIHLGLGVSPLRIILGPIMILLVR